MQCPLGAPQQTYRFRDLNDLSRLSRRPGAKGADDLPCRSMTQHECGVQRRCIGMKTGVEAVGHATARLALATPFRSTDDLPIDPISASSALVNCGRMARSWIAEPRNP